MPQAECFFSAILPQSYGQLPQEGAQEASNNSINYPIIISQSLSQPDGDSSILHNDAFKVRDLWRLQAIVMLAVVE